MISAAEARELSGITPQQRVNELEPFIREQASQGFHLLKTAWQTPDADGFWTNGGYSKSKDWLEAKKILESLGYKVTFYYRDVSVAIDMYTLIEW